MPIVSQRCSATVEWTERRSSAKGERAGLEGMAKMLVHGSKRWVPLALGLCLVAYASAASPVAVPRLSGSKAPASGVVFFLKSDVAPGAVAVGTGHTLSPEDLGRAGRVDFTTAGAGRSLARSTRFLTPPGRPFNQQGASLREDFSVYALSRAPRGVQLLEAQSSADLAAGQPVRLLGPDPESGSRTATGRVVAATPERIEIDLDPPQDVAGWGGAPVLRADADRVVGLLQASLSGAGTRVLAAPIDGVIEALARPLAGGAGEPFSKFAASAAVPATAPGPASPGNDAPLLEATAGRATQLDLAIEFPPQGSQVSSSACGTFVAGRALATRGTRRRFDVVFVIDTSRSTIEPSGSDVNGNGEVGEARMGGLGSVFGADITDRGDSILAAEVTAARQILHGLDSRATRVGLVTFAGEAAAGSARHGALKPAFTLEALTRDYTRIERGLDELVASDPSGSTHMAAGIDQATVELLGLRGAYSKKDPHSEKIVFFFTDGQPTLPYGPDAEADNVRAVLRAAGRAHRGDIRIHTFAIGPEALAGPIATVEMATRTGGTFTPVRDPGDLVDVVEEVSFADLDQVKVEQVGTGAVAEPFRITADGSWAGFLELELGGNEIRASAVADDGTAAERSVKVARVEAPENEPELPAPLLEQRNRLLEDCLLLARQRRLEQERLRNEEIRRALRLEIERERRRARERADEQRKALDLEGMDEDEDE